MSGTCLFLPFLFHHRFEFDVSLQEAQTRKLDVAVKNGKMFHSREIKDIGMVGNTTCNCRSVCSFHKISQGKGSLNALCRSTVSSVRQIFPTLAHYGSV